jgi:hypothetical protein
MKSQAQKVILRSFEDLYNYLKKLEESPSVSSYELRYNSWMLGRLDYLNNLKYEFQIEVQRFLDSGKRIGFIDGKMALNGFLSDDYSMYPDLRESYCGWFFNSHIVSIPMMVCYRDVLFNVKTGDKTTKNVLFGPIFKYLSSPESPESIRIWRDGGFSLQELYPGYHPYFSSHLDRRVFRERARFLPMSKNRWYTYCSFGSNVPLLAFAPLKLKLEGKLVSLSRLFFYFDEVNWSLLF